MSLNLRFETGAVGSLLASDAGVSPWGWDQATEETLAFPYLPDGVAYRIVGTRGALSVPNLAKYAYDPSVSADWHSPLSRTYLPVAPRPPSRRSSTTSPRSRVEGRTTRFSRRRFAHARARRGGGACCQHPRDGRRRTILGRHRRVGAVVTGQAMTKRDGRDFDAIIVGGGLAGLAATQRLAAHGGVSPSWRSAIGWEAAPH